MALLPDTRVYTLFAVILLRYLILAFLGYLIFYVIFRKRWQHKRIQLGFPAANDFRREVGYSIFTAIIFTAVGYLTFMTPFKQFTQVYTSIADHGIAYFLLSIVLLLVVHDTYFYWTHRAMHHPAVFRYAHLVHHKSTNPSPWAAMAFHPLEAVVEALYITCAVLLFPVHPLAMFIFLLIMMTYNVYGHLGYELYPKGFSRSRIGRWINTSVNHNQHHQHFKGNYGLYFLWWDRWMGTIREDYDEVFDRVPR
jgi:sterol desaturase/sphingolipid hydroxylase (fatty acid hydroxylase superfamily)